MKETLILLDPVKRGQIRPTPVADGFCVTTKFDLDHIFSHHGPKDDQPVRYEAIRAAAKIFAQVVLENTPSCADQAVALRSIRTAVMMANAAIALEGRLDCVELK